MYYPKKPAGKLKLERSLAANNFGFANTYKFKQTEAYLKANSEDPDNPLTMFGVSDVCLGDCTQLDISTLNIGRLYSILYLYVDDTANNYWAFVH